MSRRLRHSPQEHPGAPGISRRTMLAATAKLAAAAAVGALDLQRAGSAQGASPSLDAFMAVSRRLTGKSELDPALGARLHAALTRAYPDLSRAVASLDARLSAGDRTVAIPLAHAPEAERTAAQRILRGWYLGVVGDEFDAQCIAYEAILAYRPVADQVVMQTFCREAPGYWAAPPSAVRPARA